MGAGATKEEIRAGIRKWKRSIAKSLTEKKVTFRQDGDTLTGTHGIHNFVISLRIIRASNGEVAGIQEVSVDNTMFYPVYGDAAQFLLEQCR